MKKSLIITLLALGCVPLFSQGGYSLHGSITSATTNESVFMAAVVISELNIWSVTDESGKYNLKNIPAGSYTVVVSCLGFVLKEQDVTFPIQSDRFDIQIEESTLALDEIVVIAKEGKKMGSESIISQSAIEHIQPSDLTDILQLLPGQTTLNPDLSDPKQLSIRDINYSTSSVSDMESLGTALIIDGASLSNDANMQFNQTTNASTGLTASFATTAGGGVDVRQVPMDNIESIEVVRGVGSVEGGEMLNGAVKVIMKKGKTPLTAKIKVDPNVKQLSASKGMAISRSLGTLNLDVNYTKSQDDIRIDYKTYNAFGAGIAWSDIIMKDKKPMTLNLSLRGSQSVDLTQNDPDMLDIESYESSDQNLSLNFNGKWALNSPLLTNLNFLLSGTVQHQVGHEVDIENNSSGTSPQPVSYVTGEFEVPLLPSEYMSDYTIDGIPYYFETKLSGNKSFYSGKVLNNIVGGVEWKISGNNGDGRVYDLSRPPSTSSTSRPRSFKSIPAIDQLSFYLEDNANIPLGKQNLRIQAGLRYANLQPDGLFSSQENILMLDPRMNLMYDIIDNRNSILKKLTLRGGYGLFSKAPTMAYLYPDCAYHDKLAFSYYDTKTGDELAVVQTQVNTNTGNDNLKAAINRKFEGGIDLKIKDIDISVTYYHERMRNGFAFNSHYENLIFNNYDELPFEGANPYYVDGDGIYYTDPVSGNNVSLNSEKDTVFVGWTVPTNDVSVIKSGVEFTVDFGMIKSLRTALVLDGAYMKVTNQNTEDYWMKPTSAYSTGDEEYPYIALYPGGSGSIDKRISTNLRAITHMKELKMVFTTTLQVIWYRSSQEIYNDEDGNPVIYTTTDVDDIYKDCTAAKYVDPLGYIDHALVYHEFDRALAVTKQYSSMIQAYNSKWYFIETSYPPYFQINLKLTKQLYGLVDLSFFVNNITNYAPVLKIREVPYTWVSPSTGVYFGAEIKLKI